MPFGFGCGGGTLRLRRKIPLLFGEKSLKTVCFDSFTFVATIAVLASRVAKYEAALATLVGRKEVLQANVETACNKCVDLVKPEVLLDLIRQNSPESNEVRLRLRAELRKRIARIALMFVPDGALEIDGMIVMSITYVNGVRHLASFRRGDNRVILAEDVQGVGDVARRVSALLSGQVAGE